MIRHLVFLLEERSAEAMLKGIIGRVLRPDIDVWYFHFSGKQDLDNNIIRKIHNWRMTETQFIILRDKDSDNCVAIKQAIRAKCNSAGRPDTIIRIACHELETFYLGDLQAVAHAFELSLPNQNNRKYRTPDALANPSQELKKITGNMYQKIAGSRLIAPHLSVDGSNKSHSFNVLINALKKI